MINEDVKPPYHNDEEAKRQPRKQAVAGAVTPNEKETILRALKQSGWGHSTGVRNVLLAFVKSAAVRDAVADHVETAI